VGSEKGLMFGGKKKIGEVVLSFALTQYGPERKEYHKEKQEGTTAGSNRERGNR